MGVCVNNYDTAYPLGCNDSIAYKSQDGSVICASEFVGKGEAYSEGDVIGVCMRISSPKKHICPEEIN